MAQKRKHPPIPALIVVILVVVGGCVWAWWTLTRPADEAAWRLAGSLETNVQAISAATTGRVVEVKVAEGDAVEAGQELVLLDRTALELTREQAAQGVVAAKAALANAQDDSDSTKADVAAAEARVKQAEAQVSLAEFALSQATITAPGAGVVVSVATNPAQNAAPGQTLLTIADPKDLFVRVFVPEPKLGEVALGRAAKVTTDSGDSFDAEVSFVASQAEFTPNDVQTADQRTKLVYQARLRVTNPSGALKAGMPVDVALG